MSGRSPEEMMERLKKATLLLQRGEGLRNDAEKRFKETFPKAPAFFIFSLAHNLNDGVDGLSWFLKEIEDFLEGKGDCPRSGWIWDFLAHFYNYAMLRQIKPDGLDDVHGCIQDAINELKEEKPSLEGVIGMLEDVKNRLEGFEDLPVDIP